MPRFADSQSLDLEPIRTFQTVSLGNTRPHTEQTGEHTEDQTAPNSPVFQLQ
jgi:hypothetical protein